MKRLTLLILTSFTACGAADKIPEIPTLEIGGGGARFMGDARTVFDAYNNAYSDMTKQHLNIQRNLNPNGNRIAIEEALKRIVQNLETMKSLLTQPEPTTLDPYLEFYREAYTLAEQNRLGGSYGSKIEQYRREIRTKFSLSTVTLVSEEENKSTAAAEKKVPSNPSTLGEDLPPPVERTEDPVVKQSEPPVKTQPPGEGETVTYRLMYKAWQTSHDELCAAFQTGSEAKDRFHEVLESLRGLQKELEKKPSEQLQVYMNFYEKIHDDTKGFTSLPEGAKAEDVLNDLKIVAASIAKDFAPSHRK